MAQKKDRSVNFFQHNIRQYLRPYGPAYEKIEDDTVFKWSKPFQCEALIRPDVALSEFGETISVNFEKVIEYKSKFVKTSKVESLKDQTLKDLLRVCRAFNRFDKEASPTETDVEDLIDIMCEQDVADIFEDFYKIGGAFCAMGAHFLTLRALFTNEEKYAKVICCNNGNDKAFKRKPSVDTLISMLSKSVVQKPQRDAKESRKKLQERIAQRRKGDRQAKTDTESDESDESDRHASRTKRKRKERERKRKSRSPSVSQSSDRDSESDKQTVRNRRSTRKDCGQKPVVKKRKSEITMNEAEATLDTESADKKKSKHKRKGT